MWIQLRCIYYIEENGKTITLHPGDWSDKIGKQEAFRLINSNQAWIPDQRTLKGLIEDTSGIVLTGKNDALKGKLETLTKSIVDGGLGLPFTENLILNPDANIRLELIPTGFNLLKKWQMAVPLLSYETLACHIHASEEEIEETRQVIRELRVPIKNCDILFVRRCPETEELIRLWQEDLIQGKNKYLSFLRAFYRVKPVCCDLPVNWTN